MCFLYEDGEEINEYYGDSENEITTLEPERTYVIKYSFVVKSEESKQEEVKSEIKQEIKQEEQKSEQENKKNISFAF